MVIIHLLKFFKKNAEYVNKYLEKVTLPELRTCYFPRP